MYLDRIVETKKEEVQLLAKSLQKETAEQQIAALEPTLGFYKALSSRRKRQLGLIAEVKKASPSKGLIRPDFHPVELAVAYEQAGTDCISVLTDETYFQGSKTYLSEIRQAVQVPLLRKDFIIDPLQIYEARLLGADAVLLIAAILSDEQLEQYFALAASIGLDALVEVHSYEELERVLKINGVQLIGVNNRNLHTFETDIKVTAELSRSVPSGVTLISESGITGPADIDYLALNGAQGVLIGETFMRRDNITEAVMDLMGPVPSYGGNAS